MGIILKTPCKGVTQGLCGMLIVKIKDRLVQKELLTMGSGKDCPSIGNTMGSLGRVQKIIRVRVHFSLSGNSNSGRVPYMCVCVSCWV